MTTNRRNFLRGVGGFSLALPLLPLALPLLPPPLLPLALPLLTLAPPLLTLALPLTLPFPPFAFFCALPLAPNPPTTKRRGVVKRSR